MPRTKSQLLPSTATNSLSFGSPAQARSSPAAPSMTLPGGLSATRAPSWNKSSRVKNASPFKHILPRVANGTALLLHMESDGKKIFSRSELH